MLLLRRKAFRRAEIMTCVFGTWLLHKANDNLPLQFFSLPQLGALLMDNSYTASEKYRPRRKPSAALSTAAWIAPASFPVLEKPHLFLSYAFSSRLA